MKIQKQPDYLIFADSAKNGECANFPDVSRGWGVTIDQTASKPPLEWMNGAFNRVDKNMLYLLQQGVPEWCEYVKYPVDAIIKYNGVLYTAIVENDNAQPSTNTTKWKKTIAEVPNASTTQKGVVKLNSAVNSTSETEAATPLAVKKVYDGAVKRAGDTMTGQLILSKNGLKINYDNKNIMALITSDDNYSHVFYNSETKQWLSKLVYNSTANQWSFQHVDDVVVNGKSVLKTGDYGIGSLTGASTSNPNDRLPSGWYATKTSDFPDLSGNDSATLAVYGSSHKNFFVEQLFAVASKTPRIFSRCATIDGKQQWYETITTSNINNYIPVGVPLPWPTNKPPAGWFECNGSTFDKNQFPRLAAAYPSGRLPDLRSEFIRGWDSGRGVDSGRAILSHQDCALQSHNHSTPISMFSEQGADNPWGSGGSKHEGEYIFNTNYTGGNETRPRNVSFMYIVKAE